MVKVARQARELGFPALKIRFGRPNLEDDLAIIKAIREDMGNSIELMVDCNQGWRMPWDTAKPWNVDHATAVALVLESHGVYWMEEPLHRGDYEGMAELRKRVKIRIAGGELTREPYEFRELLQRGCFDVFQPDAVCTQGITGLAKFAKEVAASLRIRGATELVSWPTCTSLPALSVLHLLNSHLIHQSGQQPVVTTS
jgi:L-alanine-DL-glutamate epimerase-like enolase superfamily enzyme